MFEKFLEELGLSEKEAKTYVALLQYDSASINEIAKQTKINRTTVYPVLESLQKKGLVSEVQDGKKTEYHAEPPERLETYVERQKVVLEEQAERLKKDIVPQLKSIQKEEGERPIIKMFQGREGALSAYEEFYQFDPDKEEEGYFIFNKDLLSELYTRDEQQHFLDIRVGKKLKPISIYNYKDGDFPFRTKGVSRVRLDSEKYPIKCDISVARDRTIISTLGEHMTSFVIVSQDVADTLKSLVRKINNI